MSRVSGRRRARVGLPAPPNVNRQPADQDRRVDGASARVCSAQVVHLPPGPADGGGDAEGREGAARMGVEYREEGKSKTEDWDITAVACLEGDNGV